MARLSRITDNRPEVSNKKQSKTKNKKKKSSLRQTQKGTTSNHPTSSQEKQNASTSNSQKSKKKTATADTSMPSTQEYNESRKRAFKEANLEEEREIENYEKLLGLNKKRRGQKKKGLPQSFEDDGLAWLLTGSGEEPPDFSAIQKDDLEVVSHDSKDDSSESEATDLSDEEDVDASDIEESDSNSSDGESSVSEKSEESCKEESPEPISEPPPTRPLDETAPGPPLALTRSLRATLNRVSSRSLVAMSKTVMTTFREYPRPLVCEALTDAVLALCIDEPLPVVLLVDVAAFIALIHVNSGTDDLAATLLTRLVTNRLKVQPRRTVALMAQLLNFDVIHAKMIFEVLTWISENGSSDSALTDLQEVRLDAVTEALRHAGLKLRKDDPIRLKDLIDTCHGWKQESSTGGFTRTDFLLETLKSLKNNNLNAITFALPPDQLVDVQKTYKRARDPGVYDRPLTVALDFVMTRPAHERWWLGSNVQPLEAVKTTTDSKEGRHDRLMRKLRMNTDLRRKICLSILESKSAAQCMESLQRLNLKRGLQRNEAIAVIFELSLREKSFNKFYASLLQLIVSKDRDAKIAIKTFFWDKLKSLLSLDHSAIDVLSEMAFVLVTSNCVDLRILQRVEFADLNGPLTRLLKTLLTKIFALPATQLKTVLSVLSREDQNELRQCVLIFTQTFVKPQGQLVVNLLSD